MRPGDEFDVGWEGIPFGAAFLHLVRAAEGDGCVGRWAVVVDYHRSSGERILPASAFQHDQLPARAALELGAALFASVADSAAGLEAPRWRGPTPTPTPARMGQVDPGLSRAAPLFDDGSYRAPERTVGAPADAASAVYTAAAVVIELLVGHPLGLAETTSAEDLDAAIEDAVLEAWARAAPPSGKPRARAAPPSGKPRARAAPPSERPVDRAATDTAMALLRAALSPLPDDRPAPGELASALAAAVPEQGGDGLVGFLRRAVTTPPPAPPPRPRVRPANPPPRRRTAHLPVFEIVAGGLALLAAVVTLFIAALVVVGLSAR